MAGLVDLCSFAALLYVVPWLTWLELQLTGRRVPTAPRYQHSTIAGEQQVQVVICPVIIQRFLCWNMERTCPYVSRAALVICLSQGFVLSPWATLELNLDSVILELVARQPHSTQKLRTSTSPLLFFRLSFAHFHPTGFGSDSAAQAVEKLVTA